MKEIKVRVPPELLARVDESRGDVPRERWIRRAIESRLDDEAFAATIRAQR